MRWWYRKPCAPFVRLNRWAVLSAHISSPAKNGRRPGWITSSHATTLERRVDSQVRTRLWPAQVASDPQTWNRYSYGMNNPLRFIDPTGMDAISAEVRAEPSVHQTQTERCSGQGCESLRQERESPSPNIKSFWTSSLPKLATNTAPWAFILSG